MGFESFQVRLWGGPASFSQVDAFIRQLPNAKPDTDVIRTPRSTFYRVEDGRHIIQVKVFEPSITVSCRFTLCHPPSIDVVFLALVHEFMGIFGMKTEICDDLDPARWFSIAEFAELVDVYQQSVTKRRAEWIAAFGAAQFPATPREVYERVIRPLCTPVTHWPGAKLP